MKKHENPPRVIIVDDHPMIRQGLASLLQDEGFFVVGEASSKSEAEALLASHPADVAIIDLTLENDSGFDVLASITRDCPDVLLVVYSVHEDFLHVRRALQSGAIGYISKREDPEILLECLETVLCGRRFLSPRTARLMADAIARGAKASPIELLSTQELQVYMNLGKGLATPDISTAMGISMRTVETYYNRILIKLNLNSRRELRRNAIEYARQSF